MRRRRAGATLPSAASTRANECTCAIVIANGELCCACVFVGRMATDMDMSSRSRRLRSPAPTDLRLHAPFVLDSQRVQESEFPNPRRGFSLANLPQRLTMHLLTGAQPRQGSSETGYHALSLPLSVLLFLSVSLCVSLSLCEPQPEH